MAMLVGPTQTRTALETASRRPVVGFDPGFVERFFADRRAQLDFNASDQRGRTRQQVAQDFLDQFYKESGQRIPNWVPMNDPMPVEAESWQRKTDAARSQFETWRKDNPQSNLTFPDEGTILKQADAIALGSRRSAVELSERSSSISSTLGGIAGSIAGGAQDPVNVLSMAFGAPVTAGIVRTALIEGALNAGAEALIQGATFENKRRIDPSFTPGEAVGEVAMAGAGGVVIGGGLKGVANLWQRARTGQWPRHIRDAANVLEREASVPAARFDKSAQPAAVYRGAVEKAADDMAAGRPVELPQDAFLPGLARPGRVYDADGRSVGVSYEVVEADSLVTSHGDDMSINPAFPQELQPRDRTRAISQNQVQAIASNLQPERLGPSPQAESGAPIVGPDGLVESGNARVMALRRAYADGGVPVQNYRNYLQSQGYDLSGMNNPVLIARRVTDLEDAERVGFVTAANRSTALRLGASEQALADARLIDDAVLAKLGGDDAAAVGNRDFVRGFMQKLPRAEQGDLVDASGSLSQAGERRITAALMGRAYGEPVLLGRTLEDADNNIKGLGGALADAAGPWAKMRDAVSRGDIPRGMDITRDLLDAVSIVMRARDQGQQVKDLVEQAEMFGGPGELAKIVARAMFSDDAMRKPVSRARFSKFLDDYATEAMKNDAGPRLMGEPLEASDVLRTSLARAGREDLEKVALDRLTPEKVQEMAVADDTGDAVIMEAERMRAEALASGGAAPMVDLGDGERSLDDIFDQADDEISAAADIEACALGGTKDQQQ